MTGTTRDRTARTVVTMLAAAAVVVATTVATLVLDASTAGVDRARAAGLREFRGCADLTRSLRAVTLRHVTPYGLDLPVTSGRPMPAGAEALATERSAGDPVAAGTVPEVGPAVGSGETGTNIQEQGVDEPDIAKTDGRHVFTVRDHRLLVIDTRSGRPAATAALRLPGVTALNDPELLVVGDRVLVVGADPSGAKVRLTLVDVADPAEPRLLQTADLTGSYVTSREHDGVVRLVVASQPHLVFNPPGRSGAIPEAAGRAAARHTVEQATAASWLPRAVVRGPDGTVFEDGPLLRCRDVRHPEPIETPGLVTVVSIDPADGLRRLPSRAVTAGSDLVYASASRLYVATGMSTPWPVPATEVAGDSARGSVLPSPPQPQTSVHAFDISGPGRARYVASGTVDGMLPSRWAMSEHEGRLRVATTRERMPTSAPGGGPSLTVPRTPLTDSAVTVLEERGRRLAQVGQVGGLGPGEHIRGVRWFGNLATVVTFRQTDPVYTVDLSDPAQPRVLGELKIPGFSAYLHPIGDDMVLGVGQDGDMTGRLGMVAISVFDLSDPSAPRRVDVTSLDASWSLVLGDSRAFTYLPRQRLALVPGEAWAVEPAASGVAALRVDRAGALHPAGTLARGASVARTLPVGDLLVAVGNDVLVTYDPDTLVETGTLRLTT